MPRFWTFLQFAGQLTGQTDWWPKSDSSFITRHSEWRECINININCCWDGHKLLVLHGFQGPGESAHSATHSIHFSYFDLQCAYYVQQHFQMMWINITTINKIFVPQGSRMDEQRCSAPQISQNLGTPSPQRKDHLISDTSGPPRRSASLNRGKTDGHRQVRCHAAYYSAYSFTSTFPVP